MAQKIQIQLVDDLNGNEAQETVRFALDGNEYEIDLTTENASTLRDALSTYVDNSRKSSGRGNGRPRGASKGVGNREETQRIRQWAQENGHKASSRGRISAEIRDAYNAAQH